MASANFFKGLEIVAQRHGLPYFAMSRPGEAVTFQHTQVYAYMPSDFKVYEADPFTGVQDAVAHAHEGACDLMVFHPGYIDAYLLDHSTMTTPGCERPPCSAGPRFVPGWSSRTFILSLTTI